MFFSAPLVLLGLSASAFAAVYTTSPIATTTFTAGQEAVISWENDAANTAPSLADFGPSKISIYAGNRLQQTNLKTITESVDVSTTSSVKFTPDASIGPNSNEYFIRFESLSLKDAGAPQYPALAFSAKFTMAGMTGAFTADVQKQIDGQTTAPLAAPTGSTSVSATSAPSGSIAASTTAKSLAASVSASKTSAAPSASASNGASSLLASNAKVFAGAAVIAAIAFF